MPFYGAYVGREPAISTVVYIVVKGMSLVVLLVLVCGIARTSSCHKNKVCQGPQADTGSAIGSLIFTQRTSSNETCT